MLSFLAALLVTIVGVLHCATYLLWHYERCRSGSCGRRIEGADLGPCLLEALASLVVVSTWPLGLLGWPRTRPGAGRPVVLVHGWGLNRASMGLIAARLRRDGRVVHPETFSSRSRNLEEAAAAMADRLRAIAATSGSPTVDVVAHGVGGVLVRAAARSHGVTSLLGNVVTLGSPHRGSALALFGVPRVIAELRPGATFLDDLVRGESLPTQTHVTAIASAFDAVVFPFDLAYWPGAFNVSVEHVGHFSMLYSERVYALLAENLAVGPRLVSRSPSGRPESAS
jgi:pimeloyl-ACP methyl ester carboxylesterase